MPYTVITAIWTGASGLPGYSRFKFAGALNGADALTAAGNVRQFFVDVGPRLPMSVAVTVQPDAQIYDDNGDLTDLVAFTAPLLVQGSATGAYAAPAGAVINWLTNGSNSGKRIRGKTFLVPLNGAAFDGDGTLLTSARTTIQNAATSLIGKSPALVVASETKVLGVSTGFMTAPVVAAGVPDKAAILSSRRG